MTSFDLTDHVTGVTGGNRGIGLGLAGAGASVALWARDLTTADKAVEELRLLGRGDVEAFGCDVSDERAVAEALDTTVDCFGKVDSVFANAGTTSGVSFPDMELDELGDLFRVNVSGTFLVAWEVARHLIARDAPGSIPSPPRSPPTVGCPLLLTIRPPKVRPRPWLGPWPCGWPVTGSA